MNKKSNVMLDFVR